MLTVDVPFFNGDRVTRVRPTYHDDQMVPFTAQTQLVTDDALTKHNLVNTAAVHVSVTDGVLTIPAIELVALRPEAAH